MMFAQYIGLLKIYSEKLWNHIERCHFCTRPVSENVQFFSSPEYQDHSGVEDGEKKRLLSY